MNTLRYTFQVVPTCFPYEIVKQKNLKTINLHE